MSNVLIIGAGISGLTAAFRLRSQGIPVTVLEQSNRVGGAIASLQQDGFLVETGPNTILETSPLVTSLVSDLGLDHEKLYADQTSARRYIVRQRIPRSLPMSPGAFMGTSLFSRKAKLRLLREPFIGSWQNAYEENLAQFVRRRLGPEFLDYAINPFVAGVYAGRPERLSVRYGFPKLYALEQKYGSLIRGQIKGARERRKQGETPKTAARMFSFQNGLSTLPATIQSRLGRDVTTGVKVTRIAAADGRWTVSCQDESGSREFTARAVLFAGQAHTLSGLELKGAVPADLRSAAEIYYPPVAVLNLGFAREAVTHPLDGFGVLVPEVEQLHILGALFSSTLFPGRAPEGQVLLTVFAGGARNPELALRSESELLELALSDLRILLGVSGTPSFVHHTTWTRAIPQYEVGYGRFQELLSTLEGQHPGLFFSGSYRNGISVADTIKDAHLAAGRIAAFVTPTETGT